MRHVTSCTVCRLRKKRCIQSRAELNCTFCSSRSLPCDLVYLRGQRILRRLSGTGWRAACAELQLAPVDSAVNVETHTKHDQPHMSIGDIEQSTPYDEIIELYFNLFHNKQQIIFHHGTFMSMWEKDQIPMYLLLGMGALVARFSKHEYFQGIAPLERAEPYLTKALSLFNTRTETVSTQALQASILLSFVCFVESQEDQMALLASQAICMVQLLGLPERPTLCAVERETHIRVFWHAWMMDVWNSIWYSRSRQISAKPEYPKPLIEDIFEDMTYENEAGSNLHFGPRDSTHEGIWTKVVEITETLAEVMQFIQSMVEKPEDDEQNESNTHRLALQLRNWNRNLPEYLQHTPENRQLFQLLGRGREFAVLHLIFHYQCLILFFPYLAKSMSKTDTQCTSDLFENTAGNYASYCKAHARALSELMWTTNTTPGMECLWSPVNGHFLVVASTVHLHSLLLAQSSSDIADCKTLLEQNFVILLQLQKYWPTLKFSLSRLETIHKACERGSGLQAFDMDAWMLAFLGNYGTDVYERHIIPEDPHQAVDTGQETPWIGGLNWFDMTARARDVGSDLNSFLTFD